MKNKIIFVIGTIVVIVIALIAIIINKNNYYGNISIADIINNNSKLPVKYMSKFDSVDINLQDFEKLNNFMSEDFWDEDISFSYYGYPNDKSDYYLGQITLLTNKYNILGVTIGDNMKKSI